MVSVGSRLDKLDLSLVSVENNGEPSIEGPKLEFLPGWGLGQQL